VSERVAHAISWTRPTSTEIGTVAKSGLAAGLSWWAAVSVTDVPDPVLAPLTALVVVQVSVRASVKTALQRSAAVVLGVLLAVALGDALGLNGLTVGLLVAASLAVAELVLRFPAAAARQVPISVLVVLSTVTSDPASLGWQRAVDTVIGAAIGVVVSLTLPASRVVDARQTLDRLGDSLASALEAMAAGLQHEWSVAQTEEWRRWARTVRARLVAQTVEAVGNGREAARWNMRDRRHIETLGRYEDVVPRLERAAIGVSVIARGLDDHAHLDGTSHRAMPAMGELLGALAGAIRVLVRSVLGDATDVDLTVAFDEVRVRRERCGHAASRRARRAVQHDEVDDDTLRESEWLGYAALVVQVDRVTADLAAPLPT
jgi:uncharacterized membrane protein YgaE (UPF0421/DUF939 family)